MTIFVELEVGGGSGLHLPLFYSNHELTEEYHSTWEPGWRESLQSHLATVGSLKEPPKPGLA